MFGFSGEQVSRFGLTFGPTAFIGQMLFIIDDLARRSKAGRLGTFVLFFIPAFGMPGLVAKSILQQQWGMK